MMYLLLESALRSLALGGAVWLGLTVLRVRNPHTHMTAWIVVLVASLSMPILMHRLALTIPAAAPALRVIESIPALSSSLEATHVPAPPVQGPLALPPAAEPAVVEPPHQVMPVPAGRRSLGWRGFDWRASATVIYLPVAGMLLLRLFIGFVLTWRMARAARPIHESWLGSADVRVSDAVGVPVTFGSTVLLPTEYVDWSEAKRQAVLAHEGSHVAHGDFYVLLLATFNRAVFWFNPFAWWHLVRLAELAEIISDDAVLEMLDDRSSYAGILLDVAGSRQRAPVAIAMARACTVRTRVERILAGTAAPAHMGWRKRALVAAALAPAVIISEGTIVLSASKPPAETVAVAPSAPAREIDALSVAPSAPAQVHRSAIDAKLLDRYVGHYAADPKVLPDVVLTVMREGDHLFVRRTGEVKLEVFPESDRAFFYGVIDQRVSFRGDGPAQVMVLHQNGLEIEATRVDAAAAKRAAELFDERVADQARPRTAIDVDPSLFDRYVGYYELGPRSIFTVTREGDRLFAQLTAQRKLELFPESDREFFYKAVAAQITFVADGGRTPTALVLHQNGREFPSRRVDEARARETEARAREVTNRRADQERPRTAVAIDPRLYDRYAGLYQRGPNSIFTVMREGDRLFAQLTGQQKLELFPEGDREFFYKAVAAQITFVAEGERPPTGLILHQNGTDLRAAWLAGLPGSHGQDDQPDAKMLDRHVGWYELGPLRALAVTRKGDRLLLQETGRPKFEVIAHSDREFISTDASAFVIFMSDAALGSTTELLIHEASRGARRAVRIEAARAQAIEDAFTRRVAAAPDRFRDQVPADGSKAAVLRAIEEVQHGAPRYERMSEQLADNVRRQISQLHTMSTALGAVESVFFRGVGPGGYDIYGAKFANGLAEFRILVGPDENIEDMTFRPGGDDTPGAMVTCAQEQTLRSLPRTAPIQLLLYNGSGADIRVFELDFEGKRSRYVMIGDDRSAPILTYISHPWVVTDTSGQCVEIIMPGQNTRYLTITADAREQVVRSAPRRSSPTPGSEQALRQYIDAIGRGEPNYDDMTPQVAAETRQQLLLNQAILARLGTLRAMSFRGVTQIGNDLYIAQFANGSAEWRIGLVKEGKIGRIALGPQY